MAFKLRNRLFKFRKRDRKQKGISTMDLSIYIVVASLLLLAGLVAYNTFQDRARRVTTRDEMNTLAQACVTYQADNAGGTPPADLGALVTGLTAAQSSDGTVHGPYVTKSTWTTDASSFTDGWGNAYTYSSTARTISSSNNGGTAITKSF